ncbi:hypothetical protein OMP38_14950 [Cohnella ginsengisoli]|uniref:Uncharacterized protein n=1 Tax=Cohnella ginsengisoli TaxID=425004 RepID=A0A9X4KGT6_9BACL|nr:hypothetical protein [Cohnella ginsengisoli]MDG0792014.1 hypothetical protein [Cohnella ginsengisoli]
MDPIGREQTGAAATVSAKAGASRQDRLRTEDFPVRDAEAAVFEAARKAIRLRTDTAQGAKATRAAAGLSRVRPSLPAWTIPC